ncbi:HD domain-containing protein [Clostridium sp. A1-XYC3]|uniref:HD domain-containing protein n=1 Tax=Clostridium tanneri TaxID=3037988 RepID=A0ABU4JUX6_9CLOT|nr:HD domain-containing phosphohydrolase [Clostridium sp. A1-XYC3]MDW8801912.1 HD domain-containing protein [Clostridium sp. A1-XYC3]
MKNSKSIVSIYKKHISIIITLIITVIISIFTLLFINLHSNYENINLINILGKQRMLTQIIVKEVNRVYELNSAAEKYRDNEKEISSIEIKLEKTLNNLEKYRNEYRERYETIGHGYVTFNDKRIRFENVLQDLQPILSEHEKVWPQFDNAVNIVLKEKGNTNLLYEGVKYINENNETLLKYSNDITNIVSKYTHHRNLVRLYLTILLCIITLVFLSIFFNNAYKNLFIPITQLYKGMEEVGITDLDISAVKMNNAEFAPVFSEVKRVFNKFNSIILLIENLGRNIPFKDILNYIFDSFIEYIPYTYIGIALIKDDGKSIQASYGVSGKNHENLPKRLLGFKTSIERTSLGKIIEYGKERIINDLEMYVSNSEVTEYNRILLEEGIRSSITLPLKNDKEVVGIIFFSSNIKNVYKKEHVKFLKTLANSIMLSLEEDIIIDDMIISSTLALATLTEERDSDTGDHLNRMKSYSRIIAQLLSKDKKYAEIIDMQYIDNIERFSPLHDIGKVAIKDDILLKPSKLTEDEFETMKTHTIYGGKVLRRAEENLKKSGRNIFKIGIEIAEGHHEKWDGSGYPYGRRGEDIPLSARIVAIADVFDALTSNRPYKKAFTFEESTKIIYEGSGKHFDPYIINVFLNNIDVIKSEYNKYFALTK